MNPLIASGFCAVNEQDFHNKLEFLTKLWLPNVGDRDVVIVDNSENLPKLKSERVPLKEWPNVRVIEVAKNLGHVGSFLGKDKPKLGGWSMSWILPAQIAYCESRDVIYKESDCLAFGDWEAVMCADAEAKKLEMIFGDGSIWGSTEQSLFLIRRDFILDALSAYTNIADSDGVCLPENKFEKMERENPKIGRHSLRGGRNKPLPFNEKTFYGQKLTDDEIGRLMAMNLV